MGEKSILLEEKYIAEYIRDSLSDSKLGDQSVNNAKYHHNSRYRDAASICEHGILSLQDLKKFSVKDYSDEFLRIMSDNESHINGSDCVSLAVMGLTDLYRDEDEYDSFSPSKVDFLVTSNLKAYRSTNHYGNEFLSRQSISVDDLRSVDIRLLQLIEESLKKDCDVRELINKYNCLKNIALSMKKSQLDIPLREMSHQDGFALDIDELSKNPKLILK